MKHCTWKTSSQVLPAFTTNPVRQVYHQHLLLHSCSREQYQWGWLGFACDYCAVTFNADGMNGLACRFAHGLFVSTKV
jgi:hypothetical protein